jgi:phage shock protein PspC (stress-responsive transcriptional regulator)
MQKVIVINLNGHAYQLDEAAYDALRAYLDRAESQLAGNPDRAEIMLDLEQAIAEKCQKCLGSQKSVVLVAEVDQILVEMGPVDAGTGESGASAHGADEGIPPKDGPKTTEGAPRRLYRIREGAMVGGICNGLAAFFGIDPTIVRVLFFVLVVISTGVGILVYLGLMFLIPEATTAEELAAAYGEPFNAQEVVGGAKRGSTDERHREKWDRHWRRMRRDQRRAAAFARRMGHWGKDFGQTVNKGMGSGFPHTDYATQVLSGIMVPLFGVISALLFVLLILAIFSLVRSGGVYGFPVPNDLPLWAGILILFVLYNLVTGPLRGATLNPAFGYAPGPNGAFAVWGGIVWLVFLGFLVWYGVEHTEEVRAFLGTTLPDVLRQFSDWLGGLRAG